MRKLQNLVHFLWQLFQEMACLQLSPLRRTQMSMLWQRPEDQLGLTFLHLLIQRPPGTKTIRTCKAEGRPDLPENMKKDSSWHYQSENVCPDYKADRLWKILVGKLLFYRLKVHVVSANVLWIRNTFTTCHLSFKVSQTWAGLKSA